MPRGTRIALAFAALPFVTLVFALPFVNRTEPVVLGLPFLLFWIAFWTLVTPLALGAAYLAQSRLDPPEDEP